MGMGVVCYRVMRLLAQAAGPKRNGTEKEQKYTSGVQVIEWQTAELVFHFNGMQQDGNVTVFMPPTVDTSLSKGGFAHTP